MPRTWFGLPASVEAESAHAHANNMTGSAGSGHASVGLRPCSRHFFASPRLRSFGPSNRWAHSVPSSPESARRRATLVWCSAALGCSVQSAAPREPARPAITQTGDRNWRQHSLSRRCGSPAAAGRQSSGRSGRSATRRTRGDPHLECVRTLSAWAAAGVLRR